MGLNVYLETDKGESISASSKLSRTFCNFINRRNSSDVEPELDQIGKLLGIEVQMIYDMDEYCSPDFFAELVEDTKSEEKREEMILNNQKARNKIEGNLKQLIPLITKLKKEVDQIRNLPTLLLPTNEDILHNESYFLSSDQQEILQEEGITFSQDLGNMIAYLEAAQKEGANTVWFTYE